MILIGCFGNYVWVNFYMIKFILLSWHLFSVCLNFFYYFMTFLALFSWGFLCLLFVFYLIATSGLLEMFFSYINIETVATEGFLINISQLLCLLLVWYQHLITGHCHFFLSRFVAGKMASLIKCLPYKHEDTNSMPKSM